MLSARRFAGIGAHGKTPSHSSACSTKQTRRHVRALPARRMSVPPVHGATRRRTSASAYKEPPASSWYGAGRCPGSVAYAFANAPASSWHGAGRCSRALPNARWLPGISLIWRRWIFLYPYKYPTASKYPIAISAFLPHGVGECHSTQICTDCAIQIWVEWTAGIKPQIQIWVKWDYSYRSEPNGK